MFVDKGDEKLCQECGEAMQVVGDYGVAGQAFECEVCGYYVEEIDLRVSTISNP